MSNPFPLSEEFLYCDPECALDWISPCQQAQPCYACFLAECYELEQDSRFAYTGISDREVKHDTATV